MVHSVGQGWPVQVSGAGSSYFKYIGLPELPLPMWAAGLVSGHGGPLPPYPFADSDEPRGLGLYPSSWKRGIFNVIRGFMCFLRFGGLVALPFRA